MQHIGNKIKSVIEDSKFSAMDIAKKMSTTYQNLYRLYNRESVETRYLIELAEILNIPVTAFFEDETGGKTQAVDVAKYEELQKRLANLEAVNENLLLLIEFIKEKNLLDMELIRTKGGKDLSMYQEGSLDKLIMEMKLDESIPESEKQKKMKELFKWLEDEKRKKE